MSGDAAARLVAERRWGRVVGAAALAIVATVWGTVIFADTRSIRQASNPDARLDEAGFDRARQLAGFHDNVADQALAAALRCTGLLLTIAVGLYLYSLVRARNPAVLRAIRWLAIAGPVLVCAATIFGFLALRDVADAFMASGARTNARAGELVSDSGLLQAAGAFDLISRVVFGAWVALVSLEAMRVGLLTRFLGYWGVGAAGTLVLLPIGDAMFIGWLASVGVLALGYWPSGRPPAWQSTQALPAS